MNELIENNEENLKQAAEFIQELAEKYPPGLIPPLPRLEGFLFGVALYPDYIPMDEFFEPLVTFEAIEVLHEAEVNILRDACAMLYERSFSNVVDADVEAFLSYHKAASPETAYDKESEFHQWIDGLCTSLIWLNDAWEDILGQLKDLPDLVSEFRSAQTVLLYFRTESAGDLIMDELSKDADEPKTRKEVDQSFFGMIPWAVAMLVDCFDLFQPLDAEDMKAGPARNDPCPCGSGRKYKKCCLAKDESNDSFGDMP